MPKPERQFTIRRHAYRAVQQAFQYGFATLDVRVDEEDGPNSKAFAGEKKSGAAERGVTIPGNMVVGAFRNDFAVHMLEASVAARIEVPAGFYVTENDDGTAFFSCRLPSTALATYGSEELIGTARELNIIWQKIVNGATK